MSQIDALASRVNWQTIEANIAVDSASGCWIYSGYRTGGGYGAITVRLAGRAHLARVHRLMYHRQHGNLEDEQVVSQTVTFRQADGGEVARLFRKQVKPYACIISAVR